MRKRSIEELAEQADCLDIAPARRDALDDDGLGWDEMADGADYLDVPPPTPELGCIPAEDMRDCVQALRRTPFAPQEGHRRERIELYLWYLFQLRGCRPDRHRGYAPSAMLAQVYRGLRAHGVGSLQAAALVAGWHQECLDVHRRIEAREVDLEKDKKLRERAYRSHLLEARSLGLLGDADDPVDEAAIQQAHKRWRNASVSRPAQAAIDIIVNSLTPKK